MSTRLTARAFSVLFVFALLASTIVLWQIHPVYVSAGSCAEEPDNLLRNGSMAPNSPNSYGVVARDWNAFVVGATVPHFENAPNEGRDPQGSQYIWRDGGTWDAGIYQTVTNLTPGQTYHYWLVWGQSLHDVNGSNARSTLINRQIGVDLTGATEPNAPSVLWSVPYFDGSGFNRLEWNLYFTASSSTATFFLRAQNGHPDYRNKVFFDVACLYAAPASPTTTPWVPTSTPPSVTQTPIPNGIDDTDSQIRYRGAWQQDSDPRASNSTFHYGRGQKGARVSFEYTFRGTEITIWYIGYKNRGRAKVFIDGVKVGVLDQYTLKLKFRKKKTFGNLAPGEHTIKISNNGARNPLATASYIILDALQPGGETANLPVLKNVTQRVTPTGTRASAQPTPTPKLKRPRPFQLADPAADPPSDSSVIWDPRLPGLNVYLEPAAVAEGTLYWKLIRADYQDGFQSGGNHNMYYVITDEQKTAVANQTVWQSWPDDAASAKTNAAGTADIAMWANYWPQNGPGPYNGFVGGLPSDIVRGMGLPGNNHVNFILYFEKTVRGAHDSATSTPTPSETETPTQTPPSAPPSATPTATATPFPKIFVDDTAATIRYRGSWNVDADDKARGGTFHYGRGAKGAAVVFKYAFTGTQVTLHYLSFRNRGIATIFIDGVRVGEIDQYTRRIRYHRARTFGALTPGAHVLKVKNAGAQNPASSASIIVLDAIETQ